MTSKTAPWPRMAVGDIAIDLVDLECALDVIDKALNSQSPLGVAWANLDHIYRFHRDKSWRDRLPARPDDAQPGEMRWLVLLDGVPLTKTANALTKQQWPKLSGSDIAAPILERLAASGAQMGILGGAKTTHDQLRAQVLAGEIPPINIVGTWAPPRWEVTDPDSSRKIAAEVRAAGVDVLLVTLTKPVQEEWIAEYGPLTGAKVLIAFGAAMDFMAGRIRRAPEVVSNLGAEWLWRLILEPRRLGRRYLLQGPPAWLEVKKRARIIPGADQR